MNLDCWHRCVRCAAAVSFGVLVGTGWNAAAEPSRFNGDVPGIVRRSDIILQRANAKPEEAMPLGNGRLGVAVWAEDGFTAQFNRADTLPYRWSPGQLVIPGLKKLTGAADYSGRVDLYNGEFTEHGGGITATFYVEPDTDVFVVDVTGADPNVAQSASLHLWAPRRPNIQVQRSFGIMTETWKDSKAAGASGATFGSLAAISAEGLDVHTELAGPLGVRLSFLPKRNGTFRITVAAPHWAGGDVLKTVTPLLGEGRAISPAKHRQWWNEFWGGVGLFQMSSKDGTAEYMENLRVLDLYTAAAESGDPFPGSQAGVADLFSPLRDQHRWDPAAYWHWNLRMQVAANIGAGAYRLNNAYFRLYTENLKNIEAWTAKHMDGRPGVCVPETMRFNGQGYENETWASPALDCDTGSKPYYNARTLSTGAEVSLWIWQQYLATEDKEFLAAHYPVMADSARFLLAYAKPGANHLLHTFPSNAHETQWDVHDPTTDIAAMRALFPLVVKAAAVLKTDPELVGQMQGALRHMLTFPLTDELTLKKLLPLTADGAAQDAIAGSYDPGAPIHNSENIGLEPVWPYSLIGDEGRLHALALRTYQHRPYQLQDEWSNDPIQAARLGLRDEVKSTLVGLTEKYQAYPSGLASFFGPEFYIEQIGVVADALQEALVQDYDGVLRIAPAWPRDWDADATIYVQRRSKVNVRMRSGMPAAVIIEAGFTGKMRVRNPWAGKAVDVFAEPEHHRVSLRQVGGSVLELPVKAGVSYSLELERGSKASGIVAPLQEAAAPKPKILGKRSIGLWR